VRFEILGWPPDGPRLRLDWRRFSYAGKFVMTNTGKAVARAEEPAEAGRTDEEGRERDGEGDANAPQDGEFAEDVLAAVSFNADRTDDGVCWLRYVTVREDRRGEGIGPRLAAFVRDAALERGFERVRIAVNNPFAYQALYRAGFCFTGEETGIAELVLAAPCVDPSDGTYREGLDRYRGRESLSDAEVSFLDEHREAGRPAVLEPPDG